MRVMRAIGFRQGGPHDALVLMDVPVPAISQDEVLVRVRAVGVGIHDRWFLPTNAQFPYVIGIEGAGDVQEVGASVTAHKPGDKVMFVSSMQPKGGTWAEFAAVSARALIPIPNGLGYTEAAALPVAGGTALEGLRSLDLNEGETVFVAGASGAIGTLVIQLARARGARIAASSSPRNHAYMLSLGVEKVFDYADAGWKDELHRWMPAGVDAALAIQPGTGQPCLEVVRDGGRVVTISGDQMSPARGIRVEQCGHHDETRAALAELVAEVATGHIRVEVERTYPLADGIAALEKTETRHARGKVVVTI